MPPANPRRPLRRIPPRRLVPVALVLALLVAAGVVAVAHHGSATAVRAVSASGGASRPTGRSSAPATAAGTTPRTAGRPATRPAPRTPSAPRASTAPRASSAPPPTVGRSDKKGVASAEYSFQAPSKLSALGVSWAYNWSSSVPASTSSIEYIPMIFRASSVTAGTLARLTAGRTAGRYQTLLTFNEPDKTRQADMSPAQAIALWPKLLATGLQLSSPAVASPTDGWLSQFMALAAQHHYRVDFIALHYYGDFTNPSTVPRLVATLRTIYARYHKPVWITELGALDIRPFHETMAHTPTEGAAVSYLQQVTTALDALPFVARYAWFTDNCWSSGPERTSSLYNGSGTLTSLGAAYAEAG